MKGVIFLFVETLTKEVAKVVAGITEAKKLVDTYLAEIKDWIAKQFDPGSIPECMHQYGFEFFPIFDLCRMANDAVRDECQKFIAEDEDIQRFIGTLKRCKIKYDFFVADGNKYFFDKTHFAYDEGLFTQLKNIFDVIKLDKRRLVALFLAVRNAYPEAWYGCERTFERFAYQTELFPDGWYKGSELEWLPARNDRVARMNEKGLEDIAYIFFRVMGEDFDLRCEHNCDSTGHYDSDYISKAYRNGKFSDNGKEFFFKVERKYEQGTFSLYSLPIIAEESWERSPNYSNADFVEIQTADGKSERTIHLNFLDHLRWLDTELLFVAKGSDYVAQITHNLETAAEQIKSDYYKVKRERLITETLAKFKEPGLVKEFVESCDMHRLETMDYDPDHNLIVYIDGRSEHGSSGGVAEFSRVMLWHKGEVTYKEYQYRDRYNGANDRYEFSFASAKIEKVESSSGKLIVAIKAIPEQKKYSPIILTLTVEQKIAGSGPTTVTDQERDKFCAFFEKTQKDVLAEKTAGHKQRTGTYFRKPQFNGDNTSGYYPYPDPIITCSKVEPKFLAGAFVVRETIDAVASDLQHRFTLYLVVPGSFKEIEQDNLYEHAGDASIIGIEVGRKALEYTTRNGRKSYSF